MNKFIDPFSGQSLEADNLLFHPLSQSFFKKSISVICKSATVVRKACVSHPYIAIGVGVVVAVLIVKGIVYIFSEEESSQNSQIPILSNPATTQSQTCQTTKCNPTPHSKNLNVSQFKDLPADQQQEYVCHKFGPVFAPQSQADIPVYEIECADMGHPECVGKAQIMYLPCNHMLNCYPCDDWFIAYHFAAYVGRMSRAADTDLQAPVDENFFRDWYLNKWPNNPLNRCGYCRGTIKQRVLMLPTEKGTQ